MDLDPSILLDSVHYLVFQDDDYVAKTLETKLLNYKLKSEKEPDELKLDLLIEEQSERLEKKTPVPQLSPEIKALVHDFAGTHEMDAQGEEEEEEEQQQQQQQPQSDHEEDEVEEAVQKEEPKPAAKPVTLKKNQKKKLAKSKTLALEEPSAMKQRQSLTTTTTREVSVQTLLTGDDLYLATKQASAKLWEHLGVKVTNVSQLLMQTQKPGSAFNQGHVPPLQQAQKKQSPSYNLNSTEVSSHRSRSQTPLMVDSGISSLNSTNPNSTTNNTSSNNNSQSRKHSKEVVKIIENYRTHLRALFDRYTNGLTKKITLDGVSRLLRDRGLLKKLSMIPEVTKAFHKSSLTGELPSSLNFDEFLQCCIRLSNELLSRKNKHKYQTQPERVSFFLERLNLRKTASHLVRKPSHSNGSINGSGSSSNLNNSASGMNGSSKSKTNYAMSEQELDQEFDKFFHSGSFFGDSSHNTGRQSDNNNPAVLSNSVQKSKEEIRADHESYLRNLEQNKLINHNLPSSGIKKASVVSSKNVGNTMVGGSTLPPSNAIAPSAHGSSYSQVYLAHKEVIDREISDNTKALEAKQQQRIWQRRQRMKEQSRSKSGSPQKRRHASAESRLRVGNPTPPAHPVYVRTNNEGYGPSSSTTNSNSSSHPPTTLPSVHHHHSSTPDNRHHYGSMPNQSVAARNGLYHHSNVPNEAAHVYGGHSPMIHQSQMGPWSDQVPPANVAYQVGTSPGSSLPPVYAAPGLRMTPPPGWQSPPPQTGYYGSPAHPTAGYVSQTPPSHIGAMYPGPSSTSEEYAIFHDLTSLSQKERELLRRINRQSPANRPPDLSHAMHHPYQAHHPYPPAQKQGQRRRNL